MCLVKVLSSLYLLSQLKKDYQGKRQDSIKVAGLVIQILVWGGEEYPIVLCVCVFVFLVFFAKLSQVPAKLD